MANRTVRVDVQAGAEKYVKEMDRAGQATDRFAKKAEKVDGKKYEARFGAKTAEATKNLDRLNSELSKYDGKSVDATMGLKVANARTQALTIENQLKRLGAMEPSPTVDARIAVAEAKLRKITDSLNKVDRTNAVATVDVRTDPASRRLSMLTSGLMAVGPAGVAGAAVATGAIGGLTPILSATAIGAGTAALAFSGFGDAVKAVREAQLDPTTENLKKADEALRSFGDSGKALARQVASLGDDLAKLKRTAQGNMFPGLSSGLASARQALPAINGLVATTSRALGELGRQGGEALGSPFWRDWFNYMSTIAGPILQDLGSMLGNLVKGWAGLSKAFGPLALEISSGLADMAKSFADWATTLDKSDGFAEFCDYVRTNGPVVLDLIGQVGRLIGSVAVAAAPVGAVVLPILRDLVSILADIAGSPAGPAIVAIAAALGGMNLALRVLNGLRMSALATAILGVGSASRGAAGGVTALGNAAGGAAGKASRAASAMGVLRGAAGGLAMGLTLALAGYATYQSQIDETSRALLEGGAAAEKSRTALLDQGKAAQYGGVALYNYGDALKEAEAKAKAAYDAMTPLERANVDATRAQNDLNLAIGRFGPGSQAAIDAHRRLGEAQANQAVQTQLANRVGMDYFRTLGSLAGQNDAAGAAARRLASGLGFAGVSAMGARVEITKTGQAVAVLPNGKRITLNADGRNAEVQIQAVSTSLDKVPVGKTVNVGALTESAKAALSAIGIQVQTLPNGTVNVTARDAEARSTLIGLANFASQLQANPAIKANPAEFNRILDETLRAANVANGTVQINGDPAKFNAQRDAAIRSVNAANPIMPIHANDKPAALSIENVQRLAGTPQTLPLGANSAPARGDIRDTQSLAVQRQTFAHEANTSGARGAVANVHGQARTPQSFNTDTNTGGASSALSTLWNSWAGRVIQWAVNVVGGGRAEGGPVGGYADGGPIQRAATGMPVRSTRTLSTGRLTGPGSGTSDSIPVRAANGEWVINARTSRQQGAGLMTMLNAGLADIVPKNIPNRVVVPSGVRTGGKSSHTTVNNYITYDISGAQSPKATADAVLQKGRNLANSGLFGGQPDPTKTHMIGAA